MQLLCYLRDRLIHLAPQATLQAEFAMKAELG